MADGLGRSLRASALALLALGFNLALLCAPFAAARLWQVIVEERAYGYHLTPATLSDTTRRVERSLASLMDSEASRADAWAGLVLRELLEDDPAAARGFLLIGPTALPSGEAARLAASIPPDGGDDAVAAAALEFLPPHVRGPAGQALAFSGGGQIMIGDGQDLANAAFAFVRGEPATDRFTLRLAGYAASAPSAGDQRVQAGAALVRAARRAGALSPSFARQIDQALEAAMPEERLRAALAAAAQRAQDGADPAGAALEAFRESVEPAGAERLDALLAELGGLAAISTPAGAARLLPYAESAADLAPITLIGGAGDRAVALAKHAPDRAVFLAHARPTLNVSEEVRAAAIAFFGLLCAALAIMVATAGLMFPRPQRAEPAPEPGPPARRVLARTFDDPPAAQPAPQDAL